MAGVTLVLMLESTFSTFSTLISSPHSGGYFTGHVLNGLKMQKKKIPV